MFTPPLCAVSRVAMTSTMRRARHSRAICILNCRECRDCLERHPDRCVLHVGHKGKCQCSPARCVLYDGHEGQCLCLKHLAHPVHPSDSCMSDDAGVLVKSEQTRQEPMNVGDDRKEADTEDGHLSSSGWSPWSPSPAPPVIEIDSPTEVDEQPEKLRIWKRIDPADCLALQLFGPPLGYPHMLPIKDMPRSRPEMLCPPSVSPPRSKTRRITGIGGFPLPAIKVIGKAS